METLLKRSLRALGRALKPILRPLVRKVDGRFSALVEATVRPLVVAELERRVRPALEATESTVRESIDRTEEVMQYLRRTAQENTLLLDSLVRELVRVQVQLEALEQLVPDDASDRANRHDARDPFAPLEEISAGDRLMIG